MPSAESGVAWSESATVAGEPAGTLRMVCDGTEMLVERPACQLAEGTGAPFANTSHRRTHASTVRSRECSAAWARRLRICSIAMGIGRLIHHLPPLLQQGVLIGTAAQGDAGHSGHVSGRLNLSGRNSAQPWDSHQTGQDQSMQPHRQHQTSVLNGYPRRPARHREQRRSFGPEDHNTLAIQQSRRDAS